MSSYPTNNSLGLDDLGRRRSRSQRKARRKKRRSKLKKILRKAAPLLLPGARALMKNRSKIKKVVQKIAKKLGPRATAIIKAEIAEAARKRGIYLPGAAATKAARRLRPGRATGPAYTAGKSVSLPTTGGQQITIPVPLNVSRRGQVQMNIGSLGRRRLLSKKKRMKLQKLSKKYGKSAAAMLVLGPAGALAVRNRAKIKKALRSRLNRMR